MFIYLYVKYRISFSSANGFIYTYFFLLLTIFKRVTRNFYE